MDFELALVDVDWQISKYTLDEVCKFLSLKLSEDNIDVFIVPSDARLFLLDY